ncbi:hypothetical protein DYB25_005579 [Aphanomyces astaci]|uniref:3,4-dihydroxy-2-butanone-4-phosphate synthase n=1 Tax=Aphanomyces astaci TaxID=112090 RepID=A0A397BHC5_APHAT|nr:hypothetical protein DYB25_005579 [Aphanomyces astaci]
MAPPSIKTRRTNNPSVVLVQHDDGSGVPPGGITNYATSVRKKQRSLPKPSASPSTDIAVLGGAMNQGGGSHAAAADDRSSSFFTWDSQRGGSIDDVALQLAVSTAATNVGTSSVEDALQAIRDGKFVVVMDNEDRENEGDLITAAEKATEESLAFMIRYSSGVVCAPLTVQRINELQLPMMVPNNTEVRKCKFTVTVDLDEGNTTGISAADRARTIRALADPTVSASAFNRPGHVFPLVSVDGGVLARGNSPHVLSSFLVISLHMMDVAGHTEASVDLARLAGCTPAAFICEINDDYGRMLRRPQLEVFAQTHQLHLITISDLIRYRFSRETVVQRLTEPTVLHTPFGAATKITFGSTYDDQRCVPWMSVHDDESSQFSNDMCGCSRYDALVVGQVTSTGTLVHLVQGTLEGSIEAQFAHQHIVRQGKAGVLVFVPGYEGLVDVSGELMAQQSIFGMGLQILRQLGATSVVLVAATAPLFDTNGFGIDVERFEVLATQ